ncbi:MAG: membrane integrity-associated transporter subunit PqiC [Bradyrhizobium sp.]|nr:MlaD family protein [Bradyrhizobium sp.]MDE2376510.1 membrane integrity-associated transporter subunit PqiC [Bradyrhizobium sp.]
METRAPYVLIGAFVLAAILAVFGFIYWLNNTGGIGPRTSYRVQFQGPVPGLLVGAGVLFNGIRVGEVAELALAQDNPRFVNATISVASTTPVRADTKVGLEFQGLTGVPVVALEGGTATAKSGQMPTLIADPGAGQSMTQAARDALRRVDSVLEENSGPLKDTIANFRTFSEGLARNTGKLDSIVAGLEKMTGGGPSAPKITYDLRAPQDLGPAGKTLAEPLAIPEPTAVAMLQTQRMLFSPVKDYPGFAEFLWADSIPKLLQARLIDSFENYDIAHAPLRSTDIGQADYQLLIDVRRFRIAAEGSPVAEIGLSARIVDKNGKVAASRLVEASEKLDKIEPAAAVEAFNAAFGRIARELIGWTVQSVKPPAIPGSSGKTGGRGSGSD